MASTHSSQKSCTSNARICKPSLKNQNGLENEHRLMYAADVHRKEICPKCPSTFKYPEFSQLTFTLICFEAPCELKVCLVASTVQYGYLAIAEIRHCSTPAPKAVYQAEL